MKRGVLFVIITAALSLCSCARRAAWLYDTAEAREQALREHKSILLLASDGEDESVAFRQNVCALDEFRASFGRDFVLLELDLSTQPGEDAKEQTERLFRRLGADTFPSVYFVSSEMYVLSEIGNCGGMSYADFLLASGEPLAKAGETEELVNAVRASGGIDRARAIDALVNATDNKHRLLLKDLVEEFCELDAGNETGLLGDYKVQSAYYNALEAFENGDDPALPFTEAASDAALTNEERQELLYMAAYSLVSLPGRDLERVHSLLEEAYNIDTESAYAESIFTALEGIRRFSEIQDAEAQ